MAQEYETDFLLRRSALLAQEKSVDPKLVDALESLTRAYYADKFRKARRVGAKILRKIDPDQMPLVHARTQLLFGFALLFGKGEPETALEHIAEGIGVLEQDEFRDCHIEELVDAHRNLALYFGTLAAEFSEDIADFWAGAYEHGRAALDCFEDWEANLDLVIIVAQSAHALAVLSSPSTLVLAYSR